MKLVLASQSKTRRRMLEAAAIGYELRAGEFDEDDVKASLRERGTDALALAMGLAQAKANAGRCGMGELVLGADQTLELDGGATLDKPSSREDAARQLERLSGRPHKLHSAAALADPSGIVWSEVETVVMHVRPLSSAFIASYLDAEYEAVRHNVGCYRIEGPGIHLFDRIEGSHFAILGLPLLPLLRYLRGRNMVPA